MSTTWGEQALAMLRKDLVLEVRSRVNFNAMLFFSGMVLLIFSFALGPDPGRLRGTAGGLVWVAFTFSGVLAFSRAYELEGENSAFEGLLSIAQHRSAIYLGKMLGTVVVMTIIEIFVFPLMAILYNIDLWTSLLGLVPVVLLGTVGFAAIGSLYGALTMSLRAREVLLPLLLLPIAVPVILGAVKATSSILTGNHDNLFLWIELLVVFDVVYVTVSLLTFEYAAGE